MCSWFVFEKVKPKLKLIRRTSPTKICDKSSLD